MGRATTRIGKRAWRKVIVVLLTGVVAIGALIFWKRYQIGVWYMEGNKTVQELVVLTMLENARPIIEKELKMSLPQKILSTLAGKRNQKERQTDALKDVRKFGEVGFENHWLKFKDVHKRSSMNGFSLLGFDFVLGWNRGNGDEVLAAFNINFLKREIGRMLINQDCSYFAELKLYVEKKAKEN
jgi:hypothetical protein